jgi:hypothetical protein
MNAKLYISAQEIGLDFEDKESRDLFFANMADTRSLGFAPHDAAEKAGERTIRLHPDKFPVGYRWPISFR